MALDWDSIQKNAGGAYKPYAPDGKFTVQVKDSQVRASSTGTTWVELTFEEDDKYAYPKISHPLSFKNDSWRQWHFMCILKELGVSEVNAKKAIEACESKSGQDAKISAYEQTFKRIAGKHPQLDIIVSSEEGTNGKIYARGDFANETLSMGTRQSSKSGNQTADEVSEMLAQSEEITLDEDLELDF